MRLVSIFLFTKIVNSLLPFKAQRAAASLDFRKNDFIRSDVCWRTKFRKMFSKLAQRAFFQTCLTSHSVTEQFGLSTNPLSLIW